MPPPICFIVPSVCGVHSYDNGGLLRLNEMLPAESPQTLKRTNQALAGGSRRSSLPRLSTGERKPQPAVPPFLTCRALAYRTLWFALPAIGFYFSYPTSRWMLPSTACFPGLPAPGPLRWRLPRQRPRQRGRRHFPAPPRTALPRRQLSAPVAMMMTWHTSGARSLRVGCPWGSRWRCLLTG